MLGVGGEPTRGPVSRSPIRQQALRKTSVRPGWGNSGFLEGDSFSLLLGDSRFLNAKNMAK